MPNVVPDTSPRKNALGFAMIPEQLRSKLFAKPANELDIDTERAVRQKYRHFDIDLPVQMPASSCSVNWPIPDIGNEGIVAFTDKIAEQIAKPYHERIVALLGDALPEMPSSAEIVKEPGWYRYEPGEKPANVPHPTEPDFVLDCETLVTQGAFPIIATAVSSKAWYIWLAPEVCNPKLTYKPRLYPIGAGKLTIGHNVSYDMCRAIETHDLNDDNRSLDTMSMHIVCNGFAGPQRWVTKSKEPNKPAWAQYGSANNLIDVYNFHTWPEVPLTQDDKTLRNIFVVAPNCGVIHARLDVLIEYALRDVKYTWEVARALYPKYREARPSWISFYGQLVHGSAYLPVVNNWTDWVQNTEKIWSDKLAEIDTMVRNLAIGYVEQWRSGTDFSNDVWLSDLDWSVWEPKKRRGSSKQMFGSVPPGSVCKLSNVINASVMAGEAITDEQIYALDGSDSDKTSLLAHLREYERQREAGLLPAERPTKFKKYKPEHWLHYFRYDLAETSSPAIESAVSSSEALPVWYVRASGERFSTTKRVTHQLLKLTWNDNPVIWSNQYGFCAKYPDGTLEKLSEKPTKDTVLLSKDFIEALETEVLASALPEAQQIVKIAVGLTYWTGMRERIKSQIVAHGRNHLTGGKVLAISPPSGFVRHGTAGTGRAVEPLWLTVSSAKKHKVGTETKSRIQAPERTKLIYADLAAQELRLAAVFADAAAKYIGSTAMSFGVYAGDKATGTDSHSMLGKFCGITRDSAKSAAYAVLYFGGIRSISVSIKYGLKMLYGNGEDAPVVTDAEVRAKAKEVLNRRKGVKDKVTGKYVGGTDSEAFNFMEHTCSQPFPRSPILGCKLTQPLCPAFVGTDFLTGRGNWTIQGSARDQLDIFIVLHDWLAKHYDIWMRFAWCYHDSYLSICEDGKTDLGAYIYNVAHMMMWAYVHSKLGINDMCTMGVFFDTVAVDTVYRSESTDSTVTPSHPTGDAPTVPITPVDCLAIASELVA